MKKLLIVVIILAILALIMKVTVPSPEKHREVAKEKIKELVKEKVSTLDGIVELIEGDRDEEKMVIDFVLNGLEMRDYFVCNAGFIKYDGKEYMLTLGMFGHVFVTTDYIYDIKKLGEKVEKLQETFD